MGVLFEKDIEGGKIHGFTGNYIRVGTDYSPEYINQIKLVSLNEVGANGIMHGELVDKTEKVV
jgi:threonylcarbamoyladenosine tRNA methylthiotransferase MtaB